MFTLDNTVGMKNQNKKWQTDPQKVGYEITKCGVQSKVQKKNSIKTDFSVFVLNLITFLFGIVS